MDKIKLANGKVYSIMDYSMPDRFTVLLNGMTASEVLENLTEENLSEIQFLTDKGAVTGVYHNKVLRNYAVNGDTLRVELDNIGNEYPVDPIPPDELYEVPTAPHNIATGEYITIWNVMYKAISNIPSGEPIITGQNAVETTVEEQLYELTKGE